MHQSNQNFERDCCKASLPKHNRRCIQREDGTPNWTTSAHDGTASWVEESIPPQHPQTTPGQSESFPYRDPDQLRSVYDRIRTIAGTASHFGISESTARTWLIQYDIYDPATDGLPALAEYLEKLAPEDLGLTPLGERR